MPENVTPQEPPADEPLICDFCAIRKRTEREPDSLIASLWRLHTRVCPMWNSYRDVKEIENPPLTAKDRAVAVALGVGAATVVGVVVGVLLSRR